MSKVKSQKSKVQQGRLCRMPHGIAATHNRDEHNSGIETLLTFDF
jgi:hypothetical protein